MVMVMAIFCCFALTASAQALNSNWYTTELHQAVLANDLAQVQQLIKNGAEINSRHHTCGRTPLMLAAMHGHDKIARYLFRTGADIDLRTDTRGRNSALHYALINGHDEIACELVSANADINLRNRRNVTPLDLAKGTKNHRVLALMEKVNKTT